MPNETVEVKMQVPATVAYDPMLQFFEFEHLPPALQVVSSPFKYLATTLLDMLPRNPERTVMLRKLLEAKDCAVRAYIYKQPYKEKADAE